MKRLLHHDTNEVFWLRRIGDYWTLWRCYLGCCTNRQKTWSANCFELLKMIFRWSHRVWMNRTQLMPLGLSYWKQWKQCSLMMLWSRMGSWELLFLLWTTTTNDKNLSDVIQTEMFADQSCLLTSLLADIMLKSRVTERIEWYSVECIPPLKANSHLLYFWHHSLKNE